jgi:N,N-dimethylformamidase
MSGELRIVGYSDPLSVTPGEAVRFMVSTSLPSYRAEIVRLIHGDRSPEGPGYKADLVDSPINGEYPGRYQALHAGSYVRVPDSAALRVTGSLSLTAWIYPTTPSKGLQGILTKWAGSRGGYGLFVDETGALALWLGEPGGGVTVVGSGTPMRRATWYFVAGVYDAERGVAFVRQEAREPWPDEGSAATVEARVGVRLLGAGDTPLLIAAYGGDQAGDSSTVGGHFNGKIDRPALFGKALGPGELARLRDDAPPPAAAALLAAWDFAVDTSSTVVRDASGADHHGSTVNLPMRAVTGHNWSGTQQCHRLAPEEYGAIHFHDDDLDDARWQADFTLTIPDSLRSGFYAARLRAGDHEDHVPFFVRPRKGSPRARIAFLAPTVSYICYANEHLSWQNPRTPAAFSNIESLLQPEDRYIVQQRLLSHYDHHSDGSGVCYASRRRPLANMRPDYRLPLTRAPHQLGADLHLIDWLEAKGYEYDVITDEDLHWEGHELLDPYSVVLTGSHPEYWTTPMHDGLLAYQRAGGRLMYLGGNGMFWITSIASELPHVVELRRGQSDGMIWESAPGEYYHATTGEYGGLWRHRGRPPQRVAGVGFTAQGFDRSLPYRRTPASFDPRVAFVFEDIESDDVIGDYGLVMGGAAGFEIDRADVLLGTPPHAFILATATGFSEVYEGFPEDWLMEEYQQELRQRFGPPREGESVVYVAGLNGDANPLVRCDLVYFEGPNGSAVFSTGSIAWCGSLSHNGYDNDVSRITQNVLDEFSKRNRS